MASTAALIEALKGELRARGITYAALARGLRMSEASVKRMFSRRDCTLSRIDAVCELAGIEFSELARALGAQDATISQLSHEQERELTDNPKLMLVALCVLNHWSFDHIVSTYDLDRAECTRLLTRLDRLKFIELLPGNRIRLLASRAFAWIPDGPIQRLFKERVQADFFRSRFDGENELLVLANGTLSRAAIAAVLARLRKTVSEFSDLRAADAALPAAERSPITLLLAARPWNPEFMRRHRRRPAAATAAALVKRPMYPDVHAPGKARPGTP